MGFGLIVSGQYFSNMTYSVYPKSEFWLNSPGLIVIKLGVVMLIIAFAFVWTEFAVGAAWSWLRQLGNHIAAGLLGAHRTGLWPMVRSIQRIAQQH